MLQYKLISVFSPFEDPILTPAPLVLTSAPEMVSVIDSMSDAISCTYVIKPKKAPQQFFRTESYVDYTSRYLGPGLYVFIRHNAPVEDQIKFAFIHWMIGGGGYNVDYNYDALYMIPLDICQSTPLYMLEEGYLRFFAENKLMDGYFETRKRNINQWPKSSFKTHLLKHFCKLEQRLKSDA